MRFPTRLILVALVLAIGGALSAGVVLNPSQAPDWKVSEWINGDGGKLSGYRGKVVFIDFFQMWCPGCNEFSIPLFNHWQEVYSGRPDVQFISIHTVFEGHDVQTPEALRTFVAEKGFQHPVGIDAYESEGDEVPISMDRYDTGGTPHIVIIDKTGRMVFSHFGQFDPAPVEDFIQRRLLDNKEDGLDIIRRRGNR